jgi:hypothetical protein
LALRIKVMLSLCFVAVALYGCAPLFLVGSATSFSAERAYRHVRALAEYPRVTGTPGIEHAVEYAGKTLTDCGLSPDSQTVLWPQAILRNIVVRIPGAHPGNALLIVTHLDSVSNGAGDNASGAAVLIEVACLLRAGTPLRNDVILLFEDGEEAGYLGGYAFAARDPSLGLIRRVIGLDTAAWGPVVLLQTSPGNNDFVRAYARGVVHPAAFGFFADADWTISKDTSEIQPFYKRGLPGLELEDPTAFAGKHSTQDSADRVKLKSLQQMGDQVLSLTRTLGDSDISQASGADRSFFSLWGFGLVHFPARWNAMLAMLSAAGWIALAGLGLYRKSFAARSLLLSILLIYILVLGGAVFGVLASALFAKLFPAPNPAAGSYLVPASLPYFLAVLLLAALAYLYPRQKIAGRLGAQPVSLAGLLAWLALALACTAVLPVGSYLFTLPLSTAVLVSFLPARWRVIRLIPAVIATIVVAPNVTLTYLGAGLEAGALAVILVVLVAELWAEAYSAWQPVHARAPAPLRRSSQPA